MKTSCKTCSEPFITTVKSSCASRLQLERDASKASPAGGGAGLEPDPSAHAAPQPGQPLGVSAGLAVCLNSPQRYWMGAAAVLRKQSELGASQAAQPCTFLPFPRVVLWSVASAPGWAAAFNAT